MGGTVHKVQEWMEGPIKCGKSGRDGPSSIVCNDGCDGLSRFMYTVWVIVLSDKEGSHA